MSSNSFKAIVVGVSAGGVMALKEFVPLLPAEFPIPIIIVQHMDSRSDSFLASYLNTIGQIKVKEAEDKEPIAPATVYLAPAGYHLLIEPDETFSLSVDARVNFSCPSIDVLFDSASDVFGKNLIGIILTGANSDGSNGLKKIKDRGGIAIVQNPKSAHSYFMPNAALKSTNADFVINLPELIPLLLKLSKYQGEGGGYDTNSACA